MRLDKDTRKQIHDAKGAEVAIPWPTGAGEPLKGCTYRVQAVEDREKAEGRLQASPPRHKDVMARIHLERYGSYPEGYKPPKPKLSRPTKDDPRIEVLSVTILRRGWEATVRAVPDDPDPVRHTGLKTKVRGGPSTLFLGEDREPAIEPTETEPEQIIARPSRKEREEEDDALKMEHEVSVDRAKLAEAERKLADQRRKGKSGRLAEAALEKARRRAQLASADLPA